MSDILERLDKLKARLQDEDFLKGNGLSNEVNIHIFCYDPADEMAVRYFTEQLVSDKDVNCNIREKNLYEIFLKLCEGNRLLDKIPGLEKNKGANFHRRKFALSRAKVIRIGAQCNDSFFAFDSEFCDCN